VKIYINVHRLAHRFQFALVAAALPIFSVAQMFQTLSLIFNVCRSATCERRDRFNDVQTKSIANVVAQGVVEAGRGKNEARTLQQARSTQGGSYHKTIDNLIETFAAAVDVVKFVSVEGLDPDMQSCSSRYPVEHHVLI